MMKNALILSISIILLITFGVLEIYYLDMTSKYAISDTNYIKILLDNDDFDGAKDHIYELEETWKSMKNMWSTFVNHDEIDDIEEAMTNVREYINEKNKEEAYVNIAQVIQNFKHIPKRQELKFDNIF